MRMTPYLISAAALALALVALFRPTMPVARAAQEQLDPWKAERNYPPLVFTSRATLDCSISSTQNGRQIMKTVGGQGFSFDAPMAPIADGKVKLKDPGMNYKFNSFPTGAVAATFNGLGEGTIVEMKTEVEVDVTRYQQPGGKGTEIHFTGADIDSNGAYVEFTGLFVRKSDGKRFPFRVLFGSVGDGQGRVTPADAKPESMIMSKSVILGTVEKPAMVTTALYEAEDDVPALK